MPPPTRRSHCRSRRPPQSGFQVTLDGRLLNTPGRRPLLVPTRALATAIAAEWEWQAGRLDSSTMPLTSLAATALDEPQPRETVIAAMLSYLPTDPVVCRAEAGPVAARQERLLGPLLRWLRGATGAALEPSDSIFGAALPEEEVAKVGAHLAALSRWELAAAEQAAAAGKSVALGLALAAGALDAAAALAAARVEEDVQIEAWGLVEGGHDVDVADLRVRLAAPALFVRLLRDGGGG